MVEILLLKESPYITLSLIVLLIITSYSNQYILGTIISIILILLLGFYRHYPINKRHPDNIIVSPANGTITNIKQTSTHTYISIYLILFDIHTQVYPANGTVTERIYDDTGIFKLVADQTKSQDNEKKIHYILLDHNKKLLKVTQIAGFVPRRISSSDKINVKVKANEYLGIIKLGSRVDLLIPNENFNLQVKIGQYLNPGDIIGTYIK